MSNTDKIIRTFEDCRCAIFQGKVEVRKSDLPCIHHGYGMWVNGTNHMIECPILQTNNCACPDYFNNDKIEYYG